MQCHSEFHKYQFHGFNYGKEQPDLQSLTLTPMSTVSPQKRCTIYSVGIAGAQEVRIHYLLLRLRYANQNRICLVVT